MSEHRETRTYPLARTTEHQIQQPINVSVSAIAALEDQHRKRSRTSSNVTATSTKSSSSRRRSGNCEALTAEFDTDIPRTAQRSTPSPYNMSSVNYTKTGRVSKAKKGLKVHDCECGRSYTRAEHLRRHQRNHAQEGAMVCRYPNCGKTFYRSDLLQRHKERHDELGGNVSRHSSVSSSEHSTHPSPTHVSSSLVLTSADMLPVASYPHQPAVPPQSEVSTHSSGTKTTQNPGYLSRHFVSGPVPVDDMPTSGAWGTESFAPSPYSCSSGYASPAPCPEYGHMYATPPYGASMVRTRASSNASFIEQNWSQTSHSPTSSVSMPYPWTTDEKSMIGSTFPYSQVSYSQNNMSVHANIGTVANYGNYEPHNLDQMDNEEGDQFFPGQHYGMSEFARPYPFEQWLNNYWRFFHPTFSIVHRPTFAGINAPSMLRAAMAAIGAHYSNDGENARKIHERCVELLVKGQNMDMNGYDRQCDLQAVFLVEVFSLRFARRYARGLSTRFMAIYNQLNGLRSADPSVATSTILHDPTDEDSPQDRWLRWVRLSVRHRLLVSCYLLESQHRPMLANDRASPSPKILVGDLHFPSHESLWEAPDACQWWNNAQENPTLPRCIAEAAVGQIAGSYDAFQSSVLITALHGPFNCSSSHLQAATEHLLSGSMITQQQLSIAKLVRLVPIRALLAVSGESWILGTKVTSQEQYAVHKATLHSWVTQLWSDPSNGYPRPAVEALRIAAKILIQSLDTQERLKSHFDNKLGVLYAALVLWAATASASSWSAASGFLMQQTQPLPLSQSNAVTVAPPITHTRKAIQSDLSLSSGDFVQQASPPENSDRNSCIPHAEMVANTSHFLSTVTADPTPLNMAACQTGCISLLLWARVQLRGSHTNDQSTTHAGLNIDDNHGELINEAIGQIEKILTHGWRIWSF